MSAPAIRVFLKRGRSKPLWLGHPWVFSGAVHRVEGPVGDTGGPCLVEDDRGNVVGAGFYNPHARISVRLLQHRRTTDLPFEARPVIDVVRERLDEAIGRRATLGLPSAGTDVYRLVNAEGDRLPGLIVDCLADVAVIHVGSRAIYEAREAVADLVQGRLSGTRAVVVAVHETASKLEMIPVGVEVTRGELSGPVEVVEHGVRYRVDPIKGQKTGFYADQRENRRRFAELCRGEQVLDLYCYAGGFGLHAARGGAASVTAVDASSPACAAAAANAALNGVQDRYSVTCGDAMNWLREARAQGGSWSRIVCDPPKFAHGRRNLEDALKKYARLNTLAMSALTPGGLLLTCSCSQHVDEDTFLRMLTEAGHRLRRTVHVLAVWGQGLDHPYSAVAAEGRYLTAALVTTSPG